MIKADMANLGREVVQVEREYPHLSRDNAFVLWFLRAFLLDDVAAAKQAIVGVTNDKGIDAVHIDHENKRVLIVQGKYHTKDTAPAEPPNDVLALANLTPILHQPPSSITEYFADADPLVKDRVLHVAPFLRKRGYGLHLYFVTTGRVSEKLDKSARHAVVMASPDTGWTVLDRKRILSLLQDYLADAAPPIPMLDLPIDPGVDIKGGGMISRFDPATGIESWVFPMLGSDVGALFRQAKDRLFARNIRGFLDKTGVNVNMGRTLAKQPRNFWYFNNGISIVGDSAEKSERHGREVLRVVNPQVINGQQTTRVLASHGSRRASVLVRVIAIPRHRTDGARDFEELVSRIVEATNFQNAIKPSDLKANDHEQVRVEREFRRLNFQYLRKRESKGETRRKYGIPGRFQVKKEELVKVLGACELDPSTVLRGREKLFGDEYYRRLFSGRPAKEYLSLVWLNRIVASWGRGTRERRQARWLVLNFVKHELAKALASPRARDLFLRTWTHRADEWRLRHLDKHIDLVYRAVVSFYRAKRGKGAEALDVVPFFKRTDRDEEFKRFWGSTGNEHRARARQELERFEKELTEEGADED